ncbi:sulfate transporter CysZ [Salinisphaera sp. USBA-960]|uniref:sulfate transporter CysZ n=1 Tax=Salinisphaera orenii TaxID=856731 RepID=UPI0013A67816|nr:sulfate transporter CysZ [Salifodinibacter halophilus]NNC26352.1 sulfate transporter CysZ [Salifodinibacter halophilus]
MPRSANPVADFTTGAVCALRGFSLLRDPALRRLAVWPVIINVFVIVGLLGVFGWQLDHWLDAWVGALPGWLDWLGALLWVVGLLLALVFFAFVFVILANLIAAPFTPFLSARVEDRYGNGVPESRHGMVGEISDAVASEIKRLMYYATRALLLLLVTFVIGFIPVVNLLVGPMWLGFGALMVAFEYLDEPLGNRGMSFDKKTAFLRSHAMRHIGFGSVIMGLTLLPLVNLVVMPAAVIGATVMYLETAGELRRGFAIRLRD